MKQYKIVKKVSVLLLLFGLLVAPFSNIAKANAANALPVYRVYNPNSGEHLHTLNYNESVYLSKLGWKAEGISMYVAENGDPLYRMYNPNSGEHFYTLNWNEQVFLSGQGWKYEGVAWYTQQTGVPMYRVFNPNARNAGSHHYTASIGERDYLVRIGWKNENVAWYSSDKATEDNKTGNEDNSSPNSSILNVNACDLSGERKANVKVDIGYAEREYFAYTNAYGQLVKVEAKQLVLQNNDELSPQNRGRYCPDEAKVPGTEAPNLDEGHVIADSLGGVSNAYNITPQESKVNRSGGKQFKMETELQKALREKKSVTNFVAMIEYSNTETQIPVHYHYEVEINSQKRIFDFDNN